MAKKTFKKTNWKKVLSGILVVIVCITAISGIAAFAKNDTKTISARAFEVGGINSNGEYVETDESIFTKEMFECQGLKITPDFVLGAKYSVFFYNYDGVFIGSVVDRQDNFVENVPELAKYARIVVTPLEKTEIKWYEVYKYAKRIDITVKRDQDFVLTDWFSLDESHEGTQVTYNPNGASNGNLFVQYVSNMHDGSSNEDKTPTKPINVSKWKSLAIVYEEGNYSTSELVYFFAKPMYDSKGNRVTSTDGVEQWEIVPVGSTNVRFTGNLKQVIIDVPEGATTFFSNTFTDKEFHYSIVQYK